MLGAFVGGEGLRHGMAEHVRGTLQLGACGLGPHWGELAENQTQLNT